MKVQEYSVEHDKEHPGILRRTSALEAIGLWEKALNDVNAICNAPDAIRAPQPQAPKCKVTVLKLPISGLNPKP